MVTQLVRNIQTLSSDPGPSEPHTSLAAETEVRVGLATFPHWGMKGRQEISIIIYSSRSVAYGSGTEFPN